MTKKKRGDLALQQTHATSCVTIVFFSLSLNTKSDSTCKTKEFDLHQRQLLTKFNKVHVLK